MQVFKYSFLKQFIELFVIVDIDLSFLACSQKVFDQTVEISQTVKVSESVLFVPFINKTEEGLRNSLYHH